MHAGTKSLALGPAHWGMTGSCYTRITGGARGLIKARGSPLMPPDPMARTTALHHCLIYIVTDAHAPACRT